MKLVFHFIVVAIFISGCSFKTSQIQLQTEPLHVKVISWKELDWLLPPQKQFYQALQATCKDVSSVGEYCEIDSFEELKRRFVPAKIDTVGKITGYYEPILYASKTKTERYKYPIYKVPDDLVQIDLTSIYPELKNYRLRGRVVGKKVVPYFDHKTIDSKKIDAQVICYVDSKVDAFFLHIQGSGRIILENGEEIFVGYADQNGHPYRSIGLVMKQRGLLQEVSMQTIRSFLEKNPDLRDEILYANPSYVFFEVKNQRATGAAGVELIANASVAVDRNYIPLGLPLIIKSDKEFISPWVVAHDVGGAIKGAGRVDYFFGSGKIAAKRAGELYDDIELYTILPRSFFDK